MAKTESPLDALKAYLPDGSFDGVVSLHYPA